MLPASHSSAGITLPEWTEAEKCSLAAKTDFLSPFPLPKIYIFIHLIQKPYDSDRNDQCLGRHTSCDQNRQKIPHIPAIIARKPFFHKFKTVTQPPVPLVMAIRHPIPNIQKSPTACLSRKAVGDLSLLLFTCES